MEEKRELASYLVREYGFQFRNMVNAGYVPGQAASVGSGGEYRGWTALPSGEDRCLVSLDGREIPVRDALSDIAAAAERVLQEGGQSFLAELDDGEMAGLVGMACEEILEGQYYPYPTVSRGDREFAKYALDLAVLCGRPEGVRQAAWNLQQFVENVGSFGGALRDVYCSPFWIAVTLEPQDITENALPRMAVEAMDDLEGAALGLGECTVHFPKKICFSFDGTEEGFAERFGDVLESVAGGIWVSGADGAGREACLETVGRIFREDCARMVKGFRENYFEDRHAGEWWHDTLGMDAGEAIRYIKDQDARSRMGALKEMYRLCTAGGPDGMPARENLEELAQIGEAFRKDSHQGVATLAARIRDAAGRGIWALGRMEVFKDAARDAAGGAGRSGAGLDAVFSGEARLIGRMPDVGRLDSPVVLEVYPAGKEPFHISLEASPMAYRNSGFAAKWPALGKAADVLEQREAQAGKKGKEKGKEAVER